MRLSLYLAAALALLAPHAALAQEEGPDEIPALLLVPSGTYAPADHAHPSPDLSSIQGQIDALRARVEALEQIEVVIPDPTPDEPEPAPAPVPDEPPVVGDDYIRLGWMGGNRADLEAWLGRSIEVIHKHLVFNGGFSQALGDGQRDGLISRATKWPDSQVAIIMDLYPVTRDEPRFCEVASGDWDAELRAVAQMIVGTGHEDAIIRLWHEMDLGWRDWFKSDCWVDAWRRVHDQMMSIEGAAFVWQYNPDGGAWRAAFEQGWPGDAYVDDVAVSCYDKTSNGFASCASRLIFAREWAIARGLTLSWAEWGLWSSGGGDNPQFIQDSYDFFSMIPEVNRGYMLMFNRHEKVNIDQFPESKALFRELFGK